MFCHHQALGVETVFLIIGLEALGFDRLSFGFGGLAVIFGMAHRSQ